MFCSWPHQSQKPSLRHRHGWRAVERLCGSGTRRSSLNIFSESCSPQGPPHVVWTNQREHPGSEPILRFAGWDHPTRGSEPNPGGQSVDPGSDGRIIPTDKFTCQRKTTFWGKLITTGIITTRDCIPTEDHSELEQHVNLDLVVPQKRAFPSPNRTVRPEAKGHRKTLSGLQSMRTPKPDGNHGHVAQQMLPHKSMGTKVSHPRAHCHWHSRSFATPQKNCQPRQEDIPNAFSTNDLRQG